MSARAEDAARALSREQPTTADAAVPTPANNGSADAEGVEIPAPEPSGNKNLLPGAEWRRRRNDETASRSPGLAGGCWRNKRGSRLFLCCLVRLLRSWSVAATLRNARFCTGQAHRTVPVPQVAIYRKRRSSSTRALLLSPSCRQGAHTDLATAGADRFPGISSYFSCTPPSRRGR